MSFCSAISNYNPSFIECKPLLDKPIGECFFIIPKHIRKYGGKQHFGWAIWEWPCVILEAEFHCIWEDNEGRVFDIVPRMINFSSILFVADTKRQYNGITVENIRQSLTDDPDVLRGIELSHRIFLASRSNYLPVNYRKIPVYRDLHNDMIETQKRIEIKYGKTWTL